MKKEIHEKVSIALHQIRFVDFQTFKLMFEYVKLHFTAKMKGKYVAFKEMKINIKKSYTVDIQCYSK